MITVNLLNTLPCKVFTVAKAQEVGMGANHLICADVSDVGLETDVGMQLDLVAEEALQQRGRE